jgi:hypothetical protein
VTVQVADGGNVSCSQFFSSIPWSVQGYTFFTDFWVFPLQTYDAVLGMDWLEQFSPMKINWTEKWLLIPYKGHTVVLQGKCQYTNSPDLFHVVYYCMLWTTTRQWGILIPEFLKYCRVSNQCLIFRNVYLKVPFDPGTGSGCRLEGG